MEAIRFSVDQRIDHAHFNCAQNLRWVREPLLKRRRSAGAASA
jgi:hypothetical protein